MSVDAAFPYWIYNNSIRIHVAGNLVATALYLNYAKHIWIPATLEIIARYYVESPETRDTETFVHAMNDVQMINLQTAHSKISRMICRGNLSHAQLESKITLEKLQWLSAAPWKYYTKVQAI